MTRCVSSDGRSRMYSDDFGIGIATRQAPHTMNDKVTLAPHLVLQFGTSKNRLNRGMRPLHIWSLRWSWLVIFGRYFSTAMVLEECVLSIFFSILEIVGEPGKFLSRYVIETFRFESGDIAASMTEPKRDGDGASDECFNPVDFRVFPVALLAVRADLGHGGFPSKKLMKWRKSL